jgi:putative nucleotidyltransferase with HDIG domain
MTAKVLQLVNSSFFGLPQHVTYPKHAVSLLGLNIIRPLVLTANAFAQYEDPCIDGFSLEQSIQHSLAVATLAKKIAESGSNDNQLVDDAFIAGMMHDIGKLILAVNKSEEYAESLLIAKSKHLPLWEAEMQVFQTTHAEIGAHLLGLWGLPNPIVEAVAFHHRPSDACSGGFTPLTAVHIADVLQQPHFPGDESTADPEFDRPYVDSLCGTEKLELWSKLVGQESVA